MIQEDYISFETAKLLKEKGYWNIATMLYKENGDIVNYNVPLNNKGFSSTLDVFYEAPTLQMAMKWLREVHNIHINIDIHWLHFANQNGWMYTITKILENGTDYIDSKGDENDKTFYSSYEESCEEAIRYCLENLI